MGDPVVVESWHLPRALSDEALRLLTSLPMEEIERRLRVPVEAEGEVALIAAWLRVTGELLNRRSDIQCRVDLRLFRRAALLLERQALRPVPVAERLPGPEDCDGYGHYWWFSFAELAWVFADLEYAKNRGYTHWLPAHRLPLPPLPEFDHD